MRLRSTVSYLAGLQLIIDWIVFVHGTLDGDGGTLRQRSREKRRGTTSL